MDPFWTLARRMLRYRRLAALAALMCILSSLSLGAGLVGASPVMRAILGKREGLDDLALRFNEAVTTGWIKAPFLAIPQATIDRLPTDPFTSLC